MNEFKNLLDELEISDHYKKHIKTRFVSEVLRREKEQARSKYAYYTLKNIVVIGGVITAALTGMNNFGLTGGIVGWFAFGTALAISFASEMMDTFNISKSYFQDSRELEKLKSEGWSFLAKVNRYEEPTLHEATVLFIAKVEQHIIDTRVKKVEPGQQNTSSREASSGSITHNGNPDVTTHVNSHVINHINSSAEYNAEYNAEHNSEHNSEHEVEPLLDNINANIVINEIEV